MRFFVDETSWKLKKRNQLQDNYLTRQSSPVTNGFHSFLPCNKPLGTKEDQLVPLKLKVQNHNKWAILNVSYWTDIKRFSIVKSLEYLMPLKLESKALDLGTGQVNRIGWIFGKVPKGGGGGSFSIQKFILQNLDLKTGLFQHESDAKRSFGVCFYPITMLNICATCISWEIGS